MRKKKKECMADVALPGGRSLITDIGMKGKD